MNLPIAFRRAANAEFIEACAWYETKRRGLSVDFISEVDRCLSLASENPLQFPVVHKDIRRVVANRFPYGICFRVEKSRIVVLAIYHASREPDVWQNRT